MCICLYYIVTIISRSSAHACVYVCEHDPIRYICFVIITMSLKHDTRKPLHTYTQTHFLVTGNNMSYCVVLVYFASN